jgi:bifunctional DNA-binding transcriptional regulator/antitoxin component of YhaV-PrlF toxin-antitoxin module
MNITSTVTSKGQVTLPAQIRKAFKIGTQNRRVRFELCKDGSAKIYPVADALSLRGIFYKASRPYDPKESEKAIKIIAREAAREGLK